MHPVVIGAYLRSNTQHHGNGSIGGSPHECDWALFDHASWEDAMGRGRYVVFYLLGGLVAMLAQIAADPHSTVPNLGASGAIAAVMGAFIVTYPRDQIKSVLFIFVFARITFIPAALLIGVWFVSQLFHAGAVAHTQTGGVAYLAHVGGFIFGAVTARFFEGPRRLASQPPGD
jgi:membrane associated rhomboid family serine protease